MGHSQFGAALRSLALAVWFGGGIATILATSAVFARAESRKVAGDLAGAILLRTNRLRVVAAVLFALAGLMGAAGPATPPGGGCRVSPMGRVPVAPWRRPAHPPRAGNP